LGVDVLVVDDDPLICEVIGQALEDARLRTRCARSDQEAYGALLGAPGLRALVVDVNLGVGTTGFDVARVARRTHPGLVVVYISGEASETSFEAFRVPDSDFFEKAFDSDVLASLLLSRLTN
jgi:DNA-binding NtrC family response regulator